MTSYALILLVGIMDVMDSQVPVISLVNLTLMLLAEYLVESESLVNVQVKVTMASSVHVSLLLFVCLVVSQPLLD